jgi:hypothetical protein
LYSSGDLHFCPPEQRQSLSKAVRVEVGQTGGGESFLENLADGTGVAQCLRSRRLDMTAMLGFLALVPLSVGSTIMLGSIVVAVHAGIVMEASMFLWNQLAVLSSCQLDVHGRLLHCVLARALLPNGICGTVWMARRRCLLEFAAGVAPKGYTPVSSCRRAI